MTQLPTQTQKYWSSAQFTITDTDIEQIYNHFLEVERPQEISDISRVVIGYRIEEDRRKIKPLMRNHTVYQPHKSYSVGEAVVFPAEAFAQGEVTAVRDGNNPQHDTFQVVQITLSDGTQREYAAGLSIEHPLNEGDGLATLNLDSPDPEEIYEQYGVHIDETLGAKMADNPEFICLGNQWFVKGLMADISVGHLHLADAVLEMSEGGPLATAEILVHLDMDKNIPTEVQEFSLNHGLLLDNRFDEVAPPDRVVWFSRRLEPDSVQETPFLLQLDKSEEANYDRDLINKALRQIEIEIGDEWSPIEVGTTPMAAQVTVTYPHRRSGTLPLNYRTRPLFPFGLTNRQIITLIDETTEQKIQAWAVEEGRYITGLEEWFNENNVPVGAFITLKPREGKSGTATISLQRRPRPRREWVRLAQVEGKSIQFSLERRPVGNDYDDLMIVGTDQIAAVDALANSSENKRRSLAAILASMMPSLSQESGSQGAVHAKTLYSVVNLLRRVTPGMLFAELVRHPAFLPVGDQYWRFDQQKWQN